MGGKLIQATNVVHVPFSFSLNHEVDHFVRFLGQTFSSQPRYTVARVIKVSFFLISLIVQWRFSRLPLFALLFYLILFYCCCCSSSHNIRFSDFCLPGPFNLIFLPKPLLSYSGLSPDSD